MRIRVANIVSPNFGSSYSGITHRLFSLLSGWQDDEITLDLFGTKIKPMNMSSGNLDYHLPQGAFWSKPKQLDRKGRIKWSIDLLYLLYKRRMDYDIIHFHTLGWGALLSPILLHLLGKKVVFTMSLMGNDNPGYIRKQPRGKMQVSLLRQFDGAIGISQALVEDAMHHKIRNVEYLPNFLAIPQLEERVSKRQVVESRNKIRKKFEIPMPAKIILFIGSMIYRKGVDILVDSFIELSQKYPELYLVLVGPKSQKESSKIDEIYVNNLQNKLNQKNLKKHVLWIGMVKEQSMLVEFYRAADIFAFPTRNEGLGNVLIEASAAELPIVATLLPGITDEVVADGISGFLVENEKTDQFIAAIDKLLQDEFKQSEMGKAGRKIVLEKFSFESYCKKIKDFYLRIYYENTHQ